MNQKRLLLAVATFLSCTFSCHILAVEVQEAEITYRSDGMWRHYPLTTDGKPDERFKFEAHQASERRWDLYVRPTDTFDWSTELSFKEYTKAISRCVDRFVIDVPNGQVWSVYMSLTYDSKTWQAIRKELVSVLEKQTGVAITFSPVAGGTAEQELRSSPEIKQLGQQLGKRLKRRYDFSIFDWDHLILSRKTHADYTRSWQDIAKLPDLSLDTHSLNFELSFKPLKKAR